MVVATNATNVYFNRDTRVFMEYAGSTWEIPVLSGYGLSQGTNTSEVGLNEMVNASGTSRRGRKMFTDSRAPTEWSFDTYARPYLTAATGGVMRAVEEPLWAAFMSNPTYTPATPAWSTGVTIGASALAISTSSSNIAKLGEFNLWIVLGGATVSGNTFSADGDTLIYKIESCSANEVSITFDIDGIATLSWSGMGKSLTEQTSYTPTGVITTGISGTKNFIRNKLTVLTAKSNLSTVGSSKTYELTLTGGSITFSNNLTYLTPEMLGRVNAPIGHIPGSRAIGGTFTVYLDEKENGSADLFEDIAKADTVITNSFDLNFYVGGMSSADTPTAPGIQFDLPNCHLEVPTHSFDDVISLEVGFSALPTTISSADEAVIRYRGETTT